MQTNLPPPPPPPGTRCDPEDRRPAARPQPTVPADSDASPSGMFDRVVACIAVGTLLGILFFLFPRRTETMAVDNVIRLDTPPAAAPAPEVPVRTARPAPAEPLPDLEEGSFQTVDVVEISESSGDGTAYYGGAKVFVPGAKKGDRVRVRILRRKTSRNGHVYYTTELAPEGEGTAAP